MLKDKLHFQDTVNFHLLEIKGLMEEFLKQLNEGQNITKLKGQYSQQNISYLKLTFFHGHFLRFTLYNTINFNIFISDAS